MEPVTLTARINAKLGPVDRGKLFEDPLDEVLAALGGGVDGGGTALGESGEVAWCDIVICLKSMNPAVFDKIAHELEEIFSL